MQHSQFQPNPDIVHCPFVMQYPNSGSPGSYTGGPFKNVHHTTEGGSAQGAFDSFALHLPDPHFTVDNTAITAPIGSV